MFFWGGRWHCDFFLNDTWDWSALQSRNKKNAFETNPNYTWEVSSGFDLKHLFYFDFNGFLMQWFIKATFWIQREKAAWKHASLQGTSFFGIRLQIWSGMISLCVVAIRMVDNSRCSQSSFCHWIQGAMWFSTQHIKWSSVALTPLFNYNKNTLNVLIIIGINSTFKSCGFST